MGLKIVDQQPSQSSKNNGNGQCVEDSLKLQGKTDQASLPDGPYRGTRSKTKAALSLEPVKNAEQVRERLRSIIAFVNKSTLTE